MRGVSLEEIAGTTRISTRFLEALETESWDRLPGGVFNRGFVRTIARFLGLEEESLLAEYSLAKGEPNAPPPVPADLPAPSSASKRTGSAVSWKALVAIPLLAALAAGGWGGWQWASARRAEWNAAEASRPAAPAPPPAPSNLSPEQSSSSAPVALDDLHSSPWASPGGLQLKIDATRDTALLVTSDGQPAFSGKISAGETRSFTARTALTVDAEDAGAIRLSLDGHDLAPIGPSGQPGSITLGHPGAPASQ